MIGRKEPTSAIPTTSELREYIAKTFNLEELHLLCADLGIEYEELEGHTRSAKVQALIDYYQRRQRLSELTAQVAKARPGMQWAQPTPSTLSQRHRKNLLNNIQHVWIDGVLKGSLHSEVIKLTAGYRPEAVGHLPWDMVLKQVGQADQTISPEHLRDIFDNSGHNLLILGEPGSGKTITLLQLAESLLAEARQDANAPVPLILNLSSWAREQRPLVEWLVEEALLQYGMSRDFTRAGIAVNYFYYLLDGLDEVAAEARDACAAAINEFKATYPAEMVVCCRVAEYEALQQPLHLGSAIQIRPLNEAQINDYLSNDLSPESCTLKSGLNVTFRNR